MTRLYFAGAEQPSHRNLLADCGVNQFAINITNLNRLVKPHWDVAEHLPDGALWIAYADEQSTWDMAEWIVDQQPYLTLGPLEWALHFEPGAAYGPFWTPDGVEPGQWPVVGLTDDTVKASVTLRRIMNQYASSLLVAVTGAQRGVERLDVLVSYAWTMAQRYGETHVWAGNKLHRYAGSRKKESRPRHRADIERLGCDYLLIEADDPVETARLAIKSWQAWEERHTPHDLGKLQSSPPLASNEDFIDQEGNGSSARRLAIVPSSGGHGGDRAQVLLPGLEVTTIDRTVTDGEGVEHVESSQLLAALATSFRKCNTCYLASNCPQFKPHHNCAFEIPVHAQSKDQIHAIMRSVVEMQMQRIAFARFGEQLDGQGLDGGLSAEIDRLFTILTKMKDFMDDKDVFRLEMEARGNAGVLSRLFGAGVGEAARALPIPVASDEVLHRLTDP
jgi:hypothetical protein